MSKKKFKTNFFSIIQIIFLLLIFIILINFQIGKTNFNNLVNTNIIYQEDNSYNYIYTNLNSNISIKKLILVDFIGLNIYDKSILNNLIYDNNSKIIIYSKKSVSNYNSIDNTIFLDLISNNHKVFIPDNFCTNNWSLLKNKELYKISNLNSGNFCFSEMESLKINNILKTYNISTIEIYYTSKSHLELLDNFINYLDENLISYNFIYLENE